MPNGDAETVQFKSPTTGAVQALGSEDWEDALSRGYKPVDHTVMYSPEGKRGLVPNGELRDYIRQGYQTTPQTTFEQERSGIGINLQGAGKAAWATAKRIPSGLLSQVDPTRGLAGAGLTAIGLNPRSGTVSERLGEVPRRSLMSCRRPVTFSATSTLQTRSGPSPRRGSEKINNGEMAALSAARGKPINT